MSTPATCPTVNETLPATETALPFCVEYVTLASFVTTVPAGVIGPFTTCA